MFYQNFMRPLLFTLDAERAHEMMMSVSKAVSLNKSLLRLIRPVMDYESDALDQNILGIKFRNPVGVAAGFDKNGMVLPLIEALGFGFAEIGSITAQPSPGNPFPRLFRLKKDRSIINRMGLNNDGAKTVVKRLSKATTNLPLGINIAKTNAPSLKGDSAIEDYLTSYHEASKIADYITINISCPNTDSGKTFEDPQALSELLASLNLKSDARQKPTFLKFSVDLSREELLELLAISEKNGVDGYVVANTSSRRNKLLTSREELNKIGAGGLSGRAIAEKSTRMVRWIYEEINGNKPIIGVGGIDSVEEALNKIRAGADLLQVYSGLIFEGPALAKRINRGIHEHLKSRGLNTIHQLREMDRQPV